MVNRMIGNTKERVLPTTAESNKDLAKKFLKFFKEKIEKIRVKFPTKEPNNTGILPDPNFRHTSRSISI